MQIVDAHHHLWERGRFVYPWLKNYPAIDRDYLFQDYEVVARRCGIAKSVFVQAEVEPRFGLQEARWALSLADSEGPISAVVAWAPIEQPGLEQYLQELAGHPRLKGIRRLIQGEADPNFCARPAFVAGVRQLARFGLSFDLCVYHYQLPAVLELVRQVPEVSFVLDHIGKPDIKAGILDPWQHHLRELAKLDNVMCKVSGMATEADWQRWKPEDLRPYLDRVIQAFGFERLMFGTDWPVCTLAVEGERWLEVVQEGVKEATEEEKRQLFCDTATTFYRL